jgi:Methyltransferase domain
VTGADHWDAVYSTRGVDGVSWHQAVPALSLELIDALDIPREAAVFDVGGGASFLVDELVARGFRDLTVLDLSASALDATRERLPAGAPVRFVHADLLEWEPDRRASKSGTRTRPGGRLTPTSTTRSSTRRARGTTAQLLPPPIAEC